MVIRPTRAQIHASYFALFSPCPKKTHRCSGESFKKIVCGLKERKRWDKTMQIWVWQTGERAAVCLLGVPAGCLNLTCLLLHAIKTPPTGVHKLLRYFVLIAKLECLPLCVCVTADWSAQQIVYSSKASFGAVDLLLPYWLLMLWSFILFSFSF